MTTAKYSEGEVKAALREMDLELVSYKPNDGFGPNQNWKPCDFMVWIQPDADHIRQSGCILHEASAAWIEVKSCPAKGVAGLRLWRPSQLAGMRDAARVGIPYLTVVHWPKLKQWTIGPAGLVLEAVEGDRQDKAAGLRLHGGIPIGAFPIRCAPGQLASHLRAALLGEIT